MSEPIKVDKEVLEQIKSIRDSGLINMFDTKGLVTIAEEAEFDELLEWFKDNKNLYASGILYGFVDEDGNE